jgi:8-oxo-dGDP phosphatase
VDPGSIQFVATGADYTGVPEDINETERVEWIHLDSVRERIASGEIVGASSIAGLLHVLAFPR